MTLRSRQFQNWLDTFKVQNIEPLKLIWSVKRLQTEFLNSDSESDDSGIQAKYGFQDMVWHAI